jgi:hypothetical protein
MSDTCPFCRLKVVFSNAQAPNGSGTQLGFAEDQHPDRFVVARRCPSRDCRRTSLWMTERVRGKEAMDLTLLWPRATLRPPAPATVPAPLADAYNEAAALEGENHVACAIMARRCLEMTLKHFNFKGGNLKERIDSLAADPRASPKLKDQLHRLRESGNYAVHADLIDGLAVYEVGPTEIDGAFDALDDLFEDLFTVPDKLKKRAEDFAKKDAAAKKALAEAKAKKTA